MIESLPTLDSRKGNYDGEQIFCEADGKVYLWNYDAWYVCKNEGELNLSLYELNKQIISQMPALTSVKVDNIIRKLASKINNDQGFYMLLFNDINYYTLFAAKSILNNKHNIINKLDFVSSFSEGLYDCLYSIAEEIYAIDEKESEIGIFEIWIKPKSSEEVICGYLFPYYEGILVYGGMI